MKYLKMTIALTISAVFLYFAFRGIDIEQAMKILDAGRVKWPQLIFFTFVCQFVMYVRAWRWKYLFREEHKASTWGLTIANFIGFGTNNVLPLRVGEAVRVLMAIRKTRAPLSYTVGSIFVERTMDMLCMVAILLIGILFSQGLPELAITMGKIMAGCFAGLLAWTALITWKPNLIMKVFLPLVRKILRGKVEEKIEHFLLAFTDGLMMLRSRSAMFKVVTISILHWGLVVFSYDQMFRAFSLGPLPWPAAFLVLGYVGVSIALPSSPGFVGPIHWAIIFSLTSFGVQESLAQGFSVVMHIFMVLPMTIIGLIMISAEGLSLTTIRQEAQHVEEVEEDLSGSMEKIQTE